VNATGTILLLLLLPAAGWADAGPRFATVWQRAIPAPGRCVLAGAVLDVDGDGRDEIVVRHWYRDEPSCVTVLSGAGGEVLWSAPFPKRSVATPADLDGDGTDEVVAAWGESLAVLDGRSGVRTAALKLRAAVGKIEACSLDERPGDDIVYTAGEHADDILVALSGSDLAELWSLSSADYRGPFARGFGQPVAADLAGEGRDGVLVSENGNRLLRIGPSGERVWGVELGKRERLDPSGVVSSRPVVAGLYGDDLDVAVGCFAGAVVTLEAATGEELGRFQFGERAHASFLRNRRLPRHLREAIARTGEPIGELSAVELDGSPGPELVFGCADGFLYALDPRSGKTLWELETLDSVYEPCLALHAREGSSPLLLVWDSQRCYLVDGATGRASAPSLQHGAVEFEWSGVTAVLPCDLEGDRLTDLVCFVSSEKRVVALSTGLPLAWSGPGAHSGVR
jgi:outer membrane protein assembly factor BamB